MYGVAQADTTNTQPAPPAILISEVMPDKTAADKTDEFIELYNNSNQVFTAGSLQLQLYSSTATTWADKPFRSVTLSKDFLPGKHYLVASSVYLPDMAYDFYGSSLTAGVGHVRVILIATQQQEDYLEWGDASKNHILQVGNTFAAIPTYPGTTSQSLKRKVNEDGQLVYSAINSSDFIVSSSPSPEADNVAPDGYTIAADTSDDVQATTDGDSAALQLTELLPDPVAPQTDESDEFIELYNSGDQAINIKGYSLETSSGSTVHDYSFATDTVISAATYMAFYSKQTHLSLSNSGSQVRLLDPQKTVLDETDAYTAAPAGQSWTLLDGTWAWSSLPTPGVTNVATPPATPKPTPTPNPKATVAKVAKPKATPKPKKVAAAKKTAAKKKKVVKTASFDNTAAAVAAAPIHTKILAGVAVAAVLYGLYEYRHDISNRYHLARANRTARRAARAETKGRRVVRADQ